MDFTSTWSRIGCGTSTRTATPRSSTWPSDYWPPGKSHADVILNYEIVEYKNGKYVPAGPEIEGMVVLREDEDEDE